MNMSTLATLGGGIFRWVLQTTWQAAVLAGLILAAQWLLRKRLSPSWRYGLWLLLAARLLMPVPPQSALSIFNLARTAPPHSVAASPAPLAPAAAGIEPAAVSPPSIPMAAGPRQAPLVLQAPPPAGHAAKVDWFAVALCGWLAGVCFFGARLLWTNWRFRSRIAGYQPVADETVTRLFSNCRAAFKIRRPVRLIESEEVESPAVYGLWRKWLLLPDGVFERFSTAELRCIFLHELAHIKRGDLGVNWLVAGLQVLHWFNPVLWLAWARMRADRELATDALALAHVRQSDHASYGETILKVLEGVTGARALPGLVGIVENKAQLQERLAAIVRPGQYWKWAALTAAALLAGIGLTGAQTGRGGASETRPDLTGRLTLTNGQPVKATVFIWTARPKVGTSPFCPGCYADCGKSAKTDGQGQFKIPALDPQLIFRILVVGEGFKPKFVEEVDPGKGLLSVQLDPRNLAAAPPELTLRGRIVDAKGAPIEGAAVQARGIRAPDGGERWGALQVVDPLAVSDAQGRFVLTSREPFTSLGVWVEARSFAPKAFKKLDNDSREHELVMTEGASLKGRVLYQGKPLANVSVATLRVDREVGDYPGRFEVGTDAEGRFLFVNLPPGVRYNVAGQMSSLQNYGSIPPVTADAGADGSAKDVGDLSVQPAFRIGGRVVLGDGQPLPPQTRLVAASSGAGSATIDLDKDGHFAVGGMAPGTAYLSVQVPGYHWSLKNASLDQLNPGRLVGLVDHDITNLELLLDKGPRLTSHFDNLSESGPQPEFNPLHGVENGGASSPQRQIAGRVTDAKTGEAIPRFRVTPGRLGGMMMSLDWNPNLAVEGSSGSYVIDIDNRIRVFELKFEAEGYLPAATPPMTGEKDHCDFSLTRGSGPSGAVLLPGGQPAAGVQVLLTCPQPAGRGLLCLIGGGNFQAFRDKELLAATDAAGHFSFAPQFDMKAVAASGSAGFKLVTIESLRSNANITLEPWGNIKGLLRRPSGPGANEALAVRFAGTSAGHDLVLAINATTDDIGAFEFKQVPPGDCEIQTLVSVGEDAADTEDLQRVHVSPGQTVEVAIDAPAKAKPILLGRRGGGQDILPPIKSYLRGIVLLPDGKPAAGAQAGLKIPQQNLYVGDGEFEAGPLNDGVVRTEADGSFTVPMRDTATALYALSQAGFAKVPRERWTNGVQIILQPWGRVEGVLRLNNRPAANQKVEISEDRAFGDLFPEGGFRATTLTDDQGRFAFAHVPAGDQQISRSIPYGNNGWMSGTPTFFPVRSGETTQLTFGGKGRPVLGQCVVENLKDIPEDPIFEVVIGPASSPATPAIQTNGIQVMSARQRQEQRRSMAGQYYSATAAADGSFQVDDVAPGTYEIAFSIRGGEGRRGEMTMLDSPPKQIVVPPLSDPEKCEPFDLGVLKRSFTVENSPFLRSQATLHSLKAGDAAPAFETKALNGRPLRLEDYRGKFVLLDIRFMLPGGEMEGLQAVNTVFGRDDRFVILTLCRTADEDFLKELPAKGATHWIQGNLDFDALTGPYGLQGASFPLIMLIDPQGKIVAAGLHGDEIQSAVAAALAKK
jgi:beta-lactamase regulating signal transducer with metallopeptidase domain